jgi:flagellar biosynthesis/type III secretory pathway M-ring protein FliF/YscJ
MESTVFKNFNIFNEEYPKFRKKFSSLIQQVNKLKIIIFVLMFIIVIVIIVFLIYYFNTNKK